MARILIFGDSVSYGCWNIKGGWADYLKSFYMEKNIINSDHCYEVYNLSIDGDDSKNLFRKELQWDSMYRLAEESALGSQDAMILNLFDCSVFPFVVTMDFDLAYGVMGSTDEKFAFIPDNLYRNRLKKLKFQ